MRRNNWGFPDGYAFGGSAAYLQRALKVQPASLIGYWPHNEPSGSTAFDLSPEGNNGTYTNVTLGVTGIGDGQTGVAINGAAASYVDVYSAGFNTDFDGQEVSIAG
ncbi:MAG: hypothetical protein ACYS8Z_23465, partial [Planctomycetota bacterium]